MKILVIDPRCTDGSNLYFYTMGLAEGLSSVSEVTVASVSICSKPSDAKFRVKRVFYPFSEKMKPGKIRQLLRGVEYISGYFYLLVHTLLHKYDVIHVEWPILYRADVYFYKILKKHTSVFSLKAHNILPHSTGIKYENVFKIIYSIPDVIEVHGEKIQHEFQQLFPESAGKVVIQKHGVFMNHDISYDEMRINDGIKNRIRQFNRIYLFLGRIDSDKGVDRLVSIWNHEFDNKESLLVIAGKVSANYNEFDETEKKIKKSNNILYIPGFVDDNLLNYLVSKCNLIILPYKNGSMSGVAFTAAEFGRPLLCTNFGAIEEYIEDKDTGFISKNTDEDLLNYWKYIDAYISNNELEAIGNNMRKSFNESFTWESIGRKLNYVYSELCSKNLK